MGTKLQPGKFDCYRNALSDEPMFILLARDPAVPELVELWAEGRRKLIEAGYRPGSDWPMVHEAMNCAAEMRRWRTENDGIWRDPQLVSDREDMLAAHAAAERAHRAAVAAELESSIPAPRTAPGEPIRVPPGQTEPILPGRPDVDRIQTSVPPEVYR